MASLSIHERYGKSKYVFPWAERAQWLERFKRFHRFSPAWQVLAKSLTTGDISRKILHTSSETTLEELEKDSEPENFSISPTSTVTVIVNGNGFWGTMPFSATIDWDKIPVDPATIVPPEVTDFAKVISSMAGILGTYNDMAVVYNFSKWRGSPILPAWFPYILKHVREAHPKTLSSFYYASEAHEMFLLFKSEDGEDAMVVHFNGSKGNYGADPRFDLDDGFISNVPEAMTQAYLRWCEETNRDPAQPILTLEAPFDVMKRVDDSKKRKAESHAGEEDEGEDQVSPPQKKQKVE